MFSASESIVFLLLALAAPRCISAGPEDGGFLGDLVSGLPGIGNGPGNALPGNIGSLADLEMYYNAVYANGGLENVDPAGVAADLFNQTNGNPNLLNGLQNFVPDDVMRLLTGMIQENEGSNTTGSSLPTQSPTSSAFHTAAMAMLTSGAMLAMF